MSAHVTCPSVRRRGDGRSGADGVSPACDGRVLRYIEGHCRNLGVLDPALQTQLGHLRHRLHQVRNSGAATVATVIM